MSSFSLILRKAIEKLSRISHEKHSRPVVDKPRTGEFESLLDQVQSYNNKGTFQPLMGVGRIGDGVKRIRVDKEKEEIKADINYTISIFVSSIVYQEKIKRDENEETLDRVNVLAGYVKEFFCSTFVNR